MIAIIRHICLLVIVLPTAFALPVLAETVHVAAASNFIRPLHDIQTLFETSNNHRVILSAGSTGQLYTQIIQGAPYHVFLAADQERPQLSIESNVGVAGSQFTYAYGRLALYAPNSSEMIDLQALEHMSFDRLSLANPATAPYGAAALEVLNALRLMPKIEQRLVRGTNIAQAFQFVETGNADYGLVALSQVIEKPMKTVWRVPQQLYTPIAQDAVLLENGRGNGAAQAFLAFMKTQQVQELIKRYGYDAKPQAE